MRSHEKDTATNSAQYRMSSLHAGVDSAVLRSSVLTSSLSSQRSDAHPSGPIDAAIGIKNGLLLGGAFWALAISMFALVGYFT
ncbi:MAG: hypothetical protein QNI99_04065 [Woeseiaceae bacterium]|nr:hypothetical protein [Woeseiaceae bacterium]